MPSVCSHATTPTGAHRPANGRGTTDRSRSTSDTWKTRASGWAEDNPPMDKLRLGVAGREDELENVLTLVSNM